MSYGNTVNRLTLAELEQRASRFVDAYDPGRRSIVLVPGGMGSRLLQSLVPYRHGEPFPTNPGFRKIWVSLAAIVRGDLVELRIKKDGHDRADRPFLAQGELSTLVKRYDGTRKFFEPRANYGTFGYDWRRNSTRSATFLRAFLERIRTGVLARGHADPLPSLTLFGHSQGGMVTKLFINDLIRTGENPSAWFHRFVSAGTPFYGTVTHLSRYWVGDPTINLVMPGGAATSAEITASLPGPYTLMPAPAEVLEPRYDRLGLTRYPVRDRDDAGTPVDPFAPESRPRFPPMARDTYFARSARAFRALDRSIPEAVERVFHIRSNRHGPDPLELLWQNVDGASFDPEGASPIDDNGGAQDDTVPFWSARLADTPDDHLYDLQGAVHGSMAENDTVLQLVEELMDDAPPPPSGLQPTAADPPIAPVADVEELILDVQRGVVDEEELYQMTPAMRRAFETAFAFE